MKYGIRVLIAGLALLTVTVGHADGFVLTSPDINGQLVNKHVLSGFGCQGENISPELNWKNAPEGTKSFAVTMYDPDAPTGSGWWHWQVFDIAATETGLKANAGDASLAFTPKGSIQNPTDFGTAGYGGPCPPEGTASHQYIFTVYALKVDSLGLKADATPALLGFYLGFNTLAKASVIGYYGR